MNTKTFVQPGANGFIKIQYVYCQYDGHKRRGKVDLYIPFIIKQQAQVNKQHCRNDLCNFCNQVKPQMFVHEKTDELTHVQPTQ